MRERVWWTCVQRVVLLECNDCTFNYLPRSALSSTFSRRQRWNIISVHTCMYCTKEREQDRRCESTAMSTPVSLCQACGVDISKNKKNRHPFSGKDICPTLTEFATSVVRSLTSSTDASFCSMLRSFKLDTCVEVVTKSCLGFIHLRINSKLSRLYNL